MKIPNGWRAVPAERTAEIVLPLLEIIERCCPEKEMLPSIQSEESAAAELDKFIDRYVKSEGDDDAWNGMSLKAWSWFKEKVTRIMASGAQAMLDGKPLMIVAPDYDDDTLWKILLLNEIRSPRLRH